MKIIFPLLISIKNHQTNKIIKMHLHLHNSDLTVANV